MKLNEKTVAILENFASINQGLLVRPGATLRTISPSKATFAEAVVDESFDREFGVYDLNKLLALLSLSENPEVVLGETSLVIGGNTKRSVRMRYTDAKLITAPPSKSINVPYTIKFDLTADDLAWVFKAASILSAPNFVFAGANGQLAAAAVDVKGEIVDEATLELGETNASFKAVLKIENLKVLPGDYEVEVSPKGVAKFKSKQYNLTYWVALEQEPSQF